MKISNHSDPPLLGVSDFRDTAEAGGGIGLGGNDVDSAGSRAHANVIGEPRRWSFRIAAGIPRQKNA